MDIWFTSDCHFGHFNIIRYTGRPYKSLDDMNHSLIRNWNERVKPTDLVFHLGDFCFHNSPATVVRGEGDCVSANYYESLLNGKIMFINGSHDNNNTCRTPIERIWLRYGGKNILLLHNPDHFIETTENPSPELVLCGHVHEHWKFKRSVVYSIPIVNVGVDQWSYRPISYGEIVKELSLQEPSLRSKDDTMPEDIERDREDLAEDDEDEDGDTSDYRTFFSEGFLQRKVHIEKLGVW